MQSEGSRWRLVVQSNGDALWQERLTRDLHETLQRSNGLVVGFEEDEKAVEAGHKGAAAADVALWAAASLPAARVLITLIKEWSARERHRTVKVACRGQSITITGQPNAAQERMIHEFLDTVSAEDGSAE